MNKKRIQMHTCMTALTFLCASTFCACTNINTSAAEKTDQSWFYFHAAKKYESNKKANFYVDTDNNLWTWDSVYPDSPYIGSAFLPPTEPELMMKNIKVVVPTDIYNDLFMYWIQTILYGNCLRIWILLSRRRNCWMM